MSGQEPLSFNRIATSAAGTCPAPTPLGLTHRVEYMMNKNAATSGHVTFSSPPLTWSRRSPARASGCIDRPHDEVFVNLKPTSVSKRQELPDFGSNIRTQMQVATHAGLSNFSVEQDGVNHFGVRHRRELTVARS